jgi:hypothetical protein
VALLNKRKIGLLNQNKFDLELQYKEFHINIKLKRELKFYKQKKQFMLQAQMILL